jgi:hypothetical protein
MPCKQQCLTQAPALQGRQIPGSTKGWVQHRQTVIGISLAELVQTIRLQSSRVEGDLRKLLVNRDRCSPNTSILSNRSQIQNTIHSSECWDVASFLSHLDTRGRGLSLVGEDQRLISSYSSKEMNPQTKQWNTCHSLWRTQKTGSSENSPSSAHHLLLVLVNHSQGA